MTVPTLHPACAALPPLSETEFAELVASIKERGQRVPIVRMPNGDLLDGRTRWLACDLIGIEPLWETYAGNDPWGESAALNCQRRQMTLDQKREFAKQMLLANPLRSSLQIAKTVRISDQTVGKIRRNLEASSQIAKRDFVIGSNGQKRASHHGPKADKPPKQRFINPPFKFSKDWELTDEERGVPPGADLGDHQVKYGRVQIVPKIAKDMSDCREFWNGPAGLINTIASEHFPSPETIFEALDTLLAHVHTPNARLGNELDYARIGKDLLRTMEKNLPVAIEKLQALAEALAQRRRGRFSIVENGNQVDTGG
jgi:hypothetical protein